MSIAPSTLADSEEWDEEKALHWAEPVLWRYLSKSASLLGGIDAADVDKLTVTDLRRLVACHLISIATSEDLLGRVEELLRRMPASVTRKRETYSGFVRGRVDWPRTVQSRIATADRTLFVCEPVDRRYDTPLGRLLRLTLHCLSQLGSQAGFAAAADPSGRYLDSQAALLARRSARLLQNPKLRQVRLVDRSLLRHLEETSTRFPEARPLVEFVDLYFRGISLGDADALRQLIGRQVFAPGSPDRLFELIVGLHLLESLADLGFEVSEPLAALPAAGSPFACLEGPGGTCRLWWQRSIWPVLGVNPILGRWRRVLSENTISDPQPLMPDFIIDLPDQNRVLLVEVKLSSVGAQRERDGLRDVLAYLADVEEAQLSTPALQALVVGWNASGHPKSASQQVVVASQRRLREVARALLAPSGQGDET